MEAGRAGRKRASQARRGWNVALKPAWEPVIVARKPLIGTVAANVERYGTGAVNVDGCRVAVAGDDPNHRTTPSTAKPGMFGVTGHTGTLTSGRWPANVVLDEAAAAMLDEAVGTRSGNGGLPERGSIFNGSGRVQMWNYADSGGPSRFFYCAKASRAERNAGLWRVGNHDHSGAYGEFAGDGRGRQVEHRPQRNYHPTVKPVALMRWLVRLVTPPAGTVLDPFMGSGTTGVACAQEGFDFIGIEREEEYVEIARRRIEAAEAQMRLEVRK